MNVVKSCLVRANTQSQAHLYLEILCNAFDLEKHEKNSD